jgi:hypothetical protein
MSALAYLTDGELEEINVSFPPLVTKSAFGPLQTFVDGAANGS